MELCAPWQAAVVTEFEALAESVANGTGWLLGSFATLDGAGVVDIDFARHGVNVWVVGPDKFGTWREGRVQLDRAPSSGPWMAGDSSTSTWDGWAEVAETRPAGTWPDGGPVLGLTFESGSGSFPSRAFSSVRGVAARGVVAVEFGFGERVRRRAVDSPTGGFILTVPARPVDRSPTLRVVYADGDIVDVNL